MEKIVKRLLLVMIACMTMVFMPLSVNAKDVVDTTKAVTVTLQYDPDSSKDADGTVFKIYKVANVNSAGVMSAVNGIEVNTDKMNADEAKKLAEALKDKTPDISVTISDGTAAVENLPVGVYLLVGEEKKVGKKTFIPAPSFFSIPQEINGGYKYDAFNIDVKATYKEDSRSEKTVKYKVVKKWAGDNANVRPAEITVAIIEGTTQKETVVLNNANNWTYEWEGKKDVTYKVIEKNIPAGYSVTQTGTATEFILTNTYKEETPPPPSTTPPPPGTPPNTGDQTDLGRMGMLLGGSLIVVAIAGILLRRNK